MKKSTAAWLCALCVPCMVQAATLRVQVQTGQVRKTPSFLGEVVASVPYGQALEALSTQNSWQQVQTPDGKTGWMHSTALTTKRIAVKTSAAAVSTGASGDELALAGKGFSADVEAKFKEEHANIDFAWVDKMGQANATADEIKQFVKDGGLNANGGAL